MGAAHIRTVFLPINRYQPKQHQTGIIETTSDVDVFRIVSPGGAFAIYATAANLNDRVANLDIKLEFTMPAVTCCKLPIPPVTSMPVYTFLHCRHRALPSCDGTGEGTPLATPPTGYTDYASLGHYSIELRSLGPLNTAPVTWASAPAPFPPCHPH